MCRSGVSNKSVLQEVFSVFPDCATRVLSKSVRQECLTRVSHKSMPQECQARVFCKSGLSCDLASPLRCSFFCRNHSSTWAFEKCIRVRGFHQVSCRGAGNVTSISAMITGKMLIRTVIPIIIIIIITIIIIIIIMITTNLAVDFAKASAWTLPGVALNSSQVLARNSCRFCFLSPFDLG